MTPKNIQILKSKIRYLGYADKYYGYLTNHEVKYLLSICPNLKHDKNFHFYLPDNLSKAASYTSTFSCSWHEELEDFLPKVIKHDKPK